jgi:hypothetical protein
MLPIHNGYFSAIKNNEIRSFAGKWTELEIIILSKISQSEEDKYFIFFLMCRI